MYNGKAYLEYQENLSDPNIMKPVNGGMACGNAGMTAIDNIRHRQELIAYAEANFTDAQKERLYSKFRPKFSE